MMSTKSHTKNQLARISAKIQQLKKKYPTSSELYIPTEKSNFMSKHPIHDESQECKNFESLNKNSELQKASKHHIRNSPHQSSSQNTDRSSKQNNSFVQTQFNLNGRFYEERKYNQSCNKKSHLNKENMFPFSQQLNYQKPFKAYKQQLKNLKKEILSSLDFQNFQLSKQKTQNTPRIISNSFDTFSKKQPLNTIENTVFLNQSKHQVIESQKKAIEIQNNSQKSKHFEIQIVEENEDSISKNQQNNYQTRNSQLNSVKNYESHLSLEYLNEILKKLHEDFHSYKQEMTQKLEKIEQDSEGFSKQKAQINSIIQNIQKEIKQKELFKPSEFDFKIVEMQNQSIGKLSKQIHKEIQLINAEINAIKRQFFETEKSSESQSIQFSKDMIESYTCQFREKIMEKLDLNNQMHLKELKEVESKFFRQIFDLKNEIELMNEKIKKEEFIQKTLKTLVPQNTKNFDVQVEELSRQIKDYLLKDEQFFKSFNLNLQTIVSSKYLEQVNQKTSLQFNRVNAKISQEISKEIGSVNKTLKQFQTKMISYGILIQNVEQGLKQISNSQNDEQIQTDLINKIKEAVIKEIDSEMGSKMLYSLKESILKEKNSKGFSKELYRKTSEQIEFENTEVQICPIVNERNYVSNDASQVSIFTTQEVNSDIWLTSVDDQPSRKMFNSEVRVYEKPSTSDKNQPSFLLDQLVKNSLVFSALNH